MKGRRTRGKIISEMGDLGVWPDVNSDLLDGASRSIYINRKKALELYVQGYSVKNIRDSAGVTHQELSRLRDRCLEMSTDGAIWGFRALIPGYRIKTYERTAPINAKLPEAKGGHSGALGSLFSRYPDLEKELIAQILKKKTDGVVHEHRIRPKDLHVRFLNRLKALGFKDFDWPFNTKYQGLRTLTRFMVTVIEKNMTRAVMARESSAAQAHLSLGSSIESVLFFEDPFDAVEIDAYKMDAHFCVKFKNVDGTYSNLNLSRLWLLVILDRASTAVLWYRVVYRSECSASDVVSLISDALKKEPPAPQIDIPGLKIPESEGLPSRRFKECCQALWGVTMLDNALAHLANAVSKEARQKLGFVINYGPARHFERRASVEGLFKRIHDNVFARLPSTTGSNPSKQRAENAEKIAVELNITADAVSQIIYLYILNHNLTPTEGLCFLSPIEFIDQKLKWGNGLLIRKLVGASSGSALTIKEFVTVRGSTDDGRKPYVQIDRVRYTNPTLRSAVSLIGKEIVVEIDEQDMRQVHAFLSTGESIGVLRAHGKWGRVPHNRQTRKAINSLITKRLLSITEADDPIQVYLEYLGRQPNKGVPSSNPMSARDVMEAKRVADQAGYELLQGDFECDETKTHEIENRVPSENIVNTSMPDIAAILKKI